MKVEDIGRRWRRLVANGRGGEVVNAVEER